MQREVLGVTIYIHRTISIASSRCCSRASTKPTNMRRQRVLKRALPEQVVRSRLAAEPKLANPPFKLPDPEALKPGGLSLPSRGITFRPLISAALLAARCSALHDQSPLLNNTL
jgi:hypothetical protein